MRLLTSLSDFESVMNYSVSQVVVIDFYADWCGPCRQVAPLFESLSQQPQWDGVLFAKVNTDRSPELARQEGISALPTFKIYFNRACLKTIRGGRLDELESVLDQYYVPSIDPAICDLVQETDEQVFIAGKELLLRILDNIIREPLNEKYRSLKLSNPNVESKLLPCCGAIQCLYAAGFEDSDDKFYLSPNASLEPLKRIRFQINNAQWKKDPKSLIKSDIEASQGASKHTPSPSTRRPPTVEELIAENAFLDGITSRLRNLHFYEDAHLQAKTRSIIDLDSRKKAASSSSNESLVRELLRWFKQEFFSWFDKPNCPNCKTSCVGQRQGGVPNADEIRWLADRVELYQCPRCNHEVRFPRYNHPEKLLETRQGRCGEWANCFTLILSSSGINCRYVHDWTDHVWNEVYFSRDGQSEPMWIHCDPCEQAFDTPLLYEQGWGKKLSYIIAYTVNTKEIQDVSWRYTADFKQLMSRRTQIRESRLSTFLTKYFQQQLLSLQSQERELRLSRRTQELILFLQPSRLSGSDNELQGRTTGSLEWRQQRGELGNQAATLAVNKGSVIQPNSQEVARKEIYIRYNCALDFYERGPPRDNPRGPVKPQNGAGEQDDIVTIKGWCSLVSEWKNISRKHETDWKMVYLARQENSPGDQEGFISWTIDTSNCELVIHEVKVFASSATFENARVRWLLCGGGDNALCMPVDGFLTAKEFSGTSNITLKASISGSDGKTAWQHGQICRQKDSDEATFPLVLVVSLKQSD